MKKNICIYFMFVLTITLLTFITGIIGVDEFYSYGFSYNIASGLIPYKDFNMVIGPLYSIIFSLPMAIFGNGFYLFQLMHIIVYSLIFTFMYNKVGIRIFLLILVFAAWVDRFSYNIFCAFLTLLILLLLDSKFKYKQIFIGIIIGSMLMIKHNIGLFLLIIYIYDNRKHLLNLLSLLIPIVPIIIYLLVNNIFNSYIDFAYLGIGNFLENMYIEYLIIIPFIFFNYLLIKIYLKIKDIKILYIFVFEGLMFPIFNAARFACALIIIVYYLLLDDNYLICFKNFVKYSKLILMICSLGYVIGVFLSLPNRSLIFDNKFYKFQFVKTSEYNSYKRYSDYLDKYQDYQIFLFSSISYPLRLYRNENPGIYDLIAKGNLGRNEEEYLNKLNIECKNKKCLFLLDMSYFKKPKYTQLIPEFKDYVIKNCNYIEILPTGDRVYSNIKEDN